MSLHQRSTFSRLFKRFRRQLRERLNQAVGLPTRRLVMAQHAEDMYHRTLIEMVSHIGIQRVFFPFRGAANSSLLYFILRSSASLDIRNVVELGCGQTTLLLDSIAGKRTSFQFYSFENEPFWASQIQRQIQRSTINVKPLVAQTVRGRTTKFYDLGTSLEGKKFDLLVVDGPYGEKRYSRWGSLQLIDKHLQDEFLIIFDDAERLGEEDTYIEALRLLQEKGVKVYTRMIEAQKSQFIIATEKYRGACHF